MYSPDILASFAGGYVDIFTKSIPNMFILQFYASAGYNPNVNLKSDFLQYQKKTKDRLRLDNGKREIPKLTSAGIPFLFENNDKLVQISASFNKIMSSSLIKSFYINHNHFP